jgi:hypothetical protein
MMSFSDRMMFCLTDLTSKPGRPVTIAVSSTLFFVTAALVTAFGLANGSRNVNKRRLLNDPLSGCVLVGDETRTQGQLQAIDLWGFEERLKARLPDPDALVGVFGFRATSLAIRLKGEVTPWTFYGRTAAFDGSTPKSSASSIVNKLKTDPIISSLHRVAKNGFKKAGSMPFLVSERLAELTGLSSASPAVVTALVDDVPIDLEVTAVVENLPYHWDFVIAEPLYPRLQEAARRSRLSVFEINTGEAPEEWRGLLQRVSLGEGEHYARLEELVRLQDRHITAIAWDNSSNRLSIAMEQTPMRVWQILLKEWVQFFPEVNQKTRSDKFFNLDSDEIDELNEQTQVYAYDLAGIYLKDLSLIRMVADNADSEQLFSGYVDREAARKVERADEQTRTAMEVVWGFALIITLVAIIGLSATLFMQAKVKATEAGMLRVIGFSRHEVMSLRMIQGAMLWIPSLVGLPFGIFLGYLIVALKNPDDDIARNFGYSISVSDCITVTFSTLLTTTSVIVLASRLSLRSDPVTLLSA